MPPDAPPTLRDIWRAYVPMEQGPGIVYEGYVVAHPGTPTERHILVYVGGVGEFAETEVGYAVARREGSFGYITKNGVRVSYHRDRSSLRIAG